jgi:hypothetical protein
MFGPLGGSRLERDADKVSFPPYQATLSDSPKIIERQVELYGQDMQRLQANARSGIRHVADATRKNTGSAPEE